jgi:hypothetical protein
MRKNHRETRMTNAADQAAIAKLARQRIPTSKRTRGTVSIEHDEFLPPEDWHEPTETQLDGFRVIRQSPGPGYRHAVTPREVRDRLAQLPAWMLEPLEVVQLSRMTRKKQTFPCYGMQWGNSLYLYPIEESLVEEFTRPPKPAVVNEMRMFGGRWVHVGGSHWELHWTEVSLRDFYLNNILIHELGHLLDNRNTSYTDRERYAEWFAIEHGYRASRRADLARCAARRTVRRRHHSV